MHPRRVLGCALAAQLLAAGAVVAARLPGPASDVLVAAAGQPYAPPPPTAAPAVTPSPARAAPTPVPTALPTAFPALPPVTLPPLPPVSLPPLPTVSAPVLACVEDLGAAELPGAAASVDISRAGALPEGPVSGGGRIWYVVDGGLAGVAPDGSRVRIATPRHAWEVSVVGSRAWTVQEDYSVVLYDTGTGAEARRWTPDDVAVGGTPVYPFAVAADTTGAWILGGGEAGLVGVVRVSPDGTVVHATALPEHNRSGWAPGRGEHLATWGGSAYVGVADPGRVLLWRVSPDGSVAARREVRTAGSFANLPLAVAPEGLYAGIHAAGDGDVRLTRLALDDLRVLASAPVDEAFDLFAGGGSVYTVGSQCSYLLSRFDPVTLSRTGFWRADRGDQGHQGVVHDGRVWLLHHVDMRPVALRRYELP
ncbi:MAG TPA: hypothetical protein VF519_05285 [Mycobacteriales bacterium]